MQGGINMWERITKLMIVVLAGVNLGILIVAIRLILSEVLK